MQAWGLSVWRTRARHQAPFGLLTLFVVLTYVLSPAQSFAQSQPDGQWHKFGSQTGPERPSNGNNGDGNNEGRPPQNRPGHAGNWLRRYKDLPPAQQRRALENDPQFRRLSPQQQARLLDRLHHFSTLPPQQQERVLNRMETWEHLTQDQKQRARQVFEQFKQLPPARRQAVNRAIRDMRHLSPVQRDNLIDSDIFRNSFSPEERSLLHGAAHLPLAAGDGLQGDPPE
jgi:hypothetical protein